MTNHCQKDNTSAITPRQKPVPVGSEEVEPVPVEPEAGETAEVTELVVRPKVQRSLPPEAHDPSFQEVTEATPGPDPATRGRWMGPVADTVLADFAFYGLLAGVPVLFMWIFFGRWWIFRNADWITIGLFFWFVAVVGWRRWRW